jgi:glutamate 5-kinase
MQIAALNDEFVIVSSGAIAASKQFVKLESRQRDYSQTSLASIGQPHLMRIFHENFSDLGLLTSQCLLSYSDFGKDQPRLILLTIS